MKTIFLLLIISIVQFDLSAQNQKDWDDISYKDFSTSDNDINKIYYLHDHSNIEFNYKTGSDWYAGALDEYFTLNLRRYCRLKISKPLEMVGKRIELFNLSDSVIQKPNFIKVKIYTLKGQAIKTTKLKKKNFDIIKTDSKYFLPLDFLNIYQENVILEFSYGYVSKNKSDISWMKDDTPRNSISLEVEIPEIYIYDIKNLLSDEDVVQTNVECKDGPLIGYEMTMGSSTSGYQLYPKKWVETESQGRKYKKIHCKLTQYDFLIINNNEIKKNDNNEILKFSLVKFNEIPM